MEPEKYDDVVQALIKKGNRLHIYIREYSGIVIDKLRNSNAQISRIRPGVRSNHRFSIRVNEHLNSIIIRNKEVEPERILFEEYPNHSALVNLALDMLDDSYIKETNSILPHIHYLEPLIKLIHWTGSGNPHHDGLRLAEICTEVMDITVEFFDWATGHSSASCIKLFEDIDSHSEVTTLCRDTRSKVRRGRTDKKDRFSIDENTAFKHILKDGYSYFFSNDLTNHFEYKNARTDYLKFYQSTVIVPIRSSVSVLELHNRENVMSIMGYLCIDCEEIGVFHESETVNFLGMIAEALYKPLYEFQQGRGNGNE